MKAVDKTGGVDKQGVGWQAILQRNTGMTNSLTGEKLWDTVKKAPAPSGRKGTAVATTDKAFAKFPTKTYDFTRFDYGYFRVVIKMFWYNAKAEVSGSAVHSVDHYGLPDDPDACLNENKGPTAANDSFSVVAGSALSVGAPGVLSNDSDPEGGQLTAVLKGQSFDAGAHYFSWGGNGSFSLQTSPASSGTMTITYAAVDAEGVESPPATVTISIINQAPSAQPDTYSISANQRVDGNVLGNDRDPENGTLRAILTGASFDGAAHGFTFPGDGNFGFATNASHVGAYTFNYVAVDAAGQQSAPATVTINVANQKPESQNYYVEIRRGATVNLVVRGTDPEGGAVTYAVTAIVDFNKDTNKFSFNGNTGSWTITPLWEVGGTRHFRFVPIDAAGQRSGVEYTVTMKAI